MSMDPRRRETDEVAKESQDFGEDEDAYIEAERERRQERFRRDVDRHIFGRGGKLKIDILRAKIKLARGEEPTSRFNPRTPLKREVPFGPTTQKENEEDAEYREEVEINRGMGDNRKIYPKYPKKITQRDRVRIIQAKIKQAAQFSPESFLSENFHKANRMVGHGLFIHPNGDLIEANNPDNPTHYGAVRTYGKSAGVQFKHGPQNVDDEDIHNFLQKTGTVRLNNSLGVAHLHIATRLTQPQISAIKDYEKRFDDFEYGIGNNYKDVVLGNGSRNLLREHAKIFGQKQAQQEDTNESMTYKKSKPHKTLKEMFAPRTASQNSIELFKQQVIGPEHEEGFGFDPRHNDFVTPKTARERYGMPGVALHFIATTDNAGPVDNISGALDAIGENHFIGGWKSSTGFKTDASYIINTNDPHEVITHLKRYNQEASYSIDPYGNPYFIRNPDFKKH